MRINYSRASAKTAKIARIDHSAMVAGLLAVQAASPAAIAHTNYQVVRSIDRDVRQAIVALLDARPGWRAAADVLDGSFHPGVAALINAKML